MPSLAKLFERAGHPLFQRETPYLSWIRRPRGRPRKVVIVRGRPKKDARPVPCTLVNVVSGRTISAKSITEFCHKAGLGKLAKYHITPVMQGQRLHYRNWTMPGVADKRLDLKDVYGNRYQTTVGKLMANRTFSTQAIRRLANGEVFQGVSRADIQTDGTISPRAVRVKQYALRTKSGLVVKGQRLKDVADQTGISMHSAWLLTRGFTSSVDGVTFHRVKTEQRQALKLETVQ